MIALIDRSRDEERDIVESLGETLEGLSKSFVHGISKLPVVPAFDVSGFFEVDGVAYKFTYKITRLDELDPEAQREAIEEYRNNSEGDRR